VKTRKVKRIDIEQILMSAKDDFDAYEMILLDEIPRMKTYPEGWEAIFINAVIGSDSKVPTDYYWACAETLVSMGSLWDGLDDLLCKVLEFGLYFNQIECLYRFTKLHGWRISKRLSRLILLSFQTKPKISQCVLMLDGHLRKVLRVCKQNAGN